MPQQRGLLAEHTRFIRNADDRFGVYNILAFAVEAITPGIKVHILGITLLLTGLIAVLSWLAFEGEAFSYRP